MLTLDRQVAALAVIAAGVSEPAFPMRTIGETAGDVLLELLRADAEIKARHGQIDDLERGPIIGVRRDRAGPENPNRGISGFSA